MKLAMASVRENAFEFVAGIIERKQPIKLAVEYQSVIDRPSGETLEFLRFLHQKISRICGASNANFPIPPQKSIYLVCVGLSSDAEI